MSTFNGHALVPALTSTGRVVTVGGYASVFTDSVPISHVSRLTEHVGADGKTGALQWDDSHFELSITFRPASTTSFNLATYPLVYPKGGVVALSGFHPLKETDKMTAGALEDFLNTDDWIIVGDTTVTLNASGVAEVQLQLRRYPDSPELITTVP